MCQQTMLERSGVRNTSPQLHVRQPRDSRRGYVWHPQYPGTTARGYATASSIQGFKLNRQEARPVNVRPAGHPSPRSRGAAVLVTRGEDVARLSKGNRSLPLPNYTAATSSFGLPVLAAGTRVGRQCRPMGSNLYPNPSPPEPNFLITGSARPTGAQRPYPQGSPACEILLCRTPSPAPGCSVSEDCQQQAPKPAKPSRPPGPPSPHILEEQRKRRKILALQKAQQPSVQWCANGGQSTSGDTRAGGAGSSQHSFFPGQPRRGSGLTTQGPARRPGSGLNIRAAGGATQHLVQARVSILRGGGASKAEPTGDGGHLLMGDWETEVERESQEAAVVNSRGRKGRISPVLTIPVSGPLCLTPSRTESDGGTSSGVLPSSSSTSEWTELWDEEMEASFYYNFITREARWVRPSGL